MPNSFRSLRWCAALLLPVVVLQAEQLSRAFELRYVSSDPRANGETDFKGETSIFTTEQRLEYLAQYESFAGRFFRDKNWDQVVVSEEDVRLVKQKIKPQPLPEVRRRFPLADWKYLGSRPGQRDEEVKALAKWQALKGAAVVAGELVLNGSVDGITVPFPSQGWRFRLEWKVKVPAAKQSVVFDLDGVAEVGLAADGSFTFRSGEGSGVGGKWTAGQWHLLTLEVDLETGCYNFFADEKLVADFVPVIAKRSVGKLAIKGPKGLRLDNIWGVGYDKRYDPQGDRHTRDVPFGIKTFIDEDFAVRADAGNWAASGYDDSSWAQVPTWPYAHGGERYEDETLYLRTRIKLDQYERAELSSECLDPSGEVWINGRPVEVRRDRRPFTLDVTAYLKPDAENVIAVRVDPFRVTRTMRHTPADLNTGWSAGRMWLDLIPQTRIKDVFVHTRTLSINSAELAVQAVIRNDQVIHALEREAKNDNTFHGKVAVALYPWFPQEAPSPAVSASFPVSIELGRDYTWQGNLTLPEPNLWFPESPHLYKVVVRLENDQGMVIDDSVITTGVRTVSQEGGTFRINGRPSMMNGGLVFGFRSPLHRIAQWLRCPPDESLLRDLLLVKKMNGNTVRMSQHDGPAVGINDPRYAEFGDQLGVMFQWGTTSWVRTDSAYLLDFEGLPAYIRQVRNHPSIVMWQPTNHPKFFGAPERGLEWFKRVYDTIWREDESRLIAPVSSLKQLKPRNDEGTIDHEGKAVDPVAAWIAPMITRGTMDHITGYGAEWSELRKYPNPGVYEGEQGWRETGFRTDYLNSPVRAYFDFESEESNAQPNWSLHRGKPEYHIRSYELDQDRSFGRELTVADWRISQAWQAMSAYEAYRKKRWLDYDGLVWCTIDGGGNTGTYEKPLTDYYGQAKISFHAVKMAFQPLLAGSGNVDLAYGPADRIPIVVLNLGKERKVDVLVRVRTLEGVQLAQKIFSGVDLYGGRTVTTLASQRFDVPDGLYIFEYAVTTPHDS